jgi:hypothetical protein
MAAKKKRSAKKGGGKQKKGKRGATRTPRTTEDVIDANRSGSSLPDEIVEEALIGGDHRDLLEDYFGEDVYEELRALATRSRRAQVRGGPRVLILPVIMGSKLGTRGRVFDDTIWIDPVDVIAGRLAKLELKAGDSAIEPLGVLLTTYLKLKLMQGLIRGVCDADAKSWLRAVTFCERDQHPFEQMHQEILRLSSLSLFDDTEISQASEMCFLTVRAIKVRNSSRPYVFRAKFSLSAWLIAVTM